MARVTKLNVMLTASVKGLSAGISKAQGMLKSLTRDANRMRADFGKAFSGAAGMAGRAFVGISTAATAAGASIAYLTKKSIDAVGDTNDFAKSLGLTYNQLRKIQFAAGQAGVDSDALNASFAKMSDTLGSAMGGNASAIKAFENIGLTVEKLSRMSPGQQFEAIANAINKIQDPSQKMAAARDIFGKSGGQLIALFDNAGQAIREAGTTLDTFGISLTQIDVSKIDDAGDAMGKLNLILEGIGNQLAANVSPYITQATEDVIAWVQEMGGVGPAIDAAFGGVLDKLDAVLNRIDKINAGWQTFIGGAQGAIGKGLAAADKFAKKGSFSKSVDAYAREQELQKRAQSIPADKREEFIRRARESGGFADPSVNTAALAEGFNGAAAERQASADASNARVSKGNSYGDSFRQWRAKADANANAASATPSAPGTWVDRLQSRYGNMMPGANQPKRATGDDAALQVLRNIEANTGKNTLAYAG